MAAKLELMYHILSIKETDPMVQKNDHICYTLFYNLCLKFKFMLCVTGSRMNRIMASLRSKILSFFFKFFFEISVSEMESNK